MDTVVKFLLDYIPDPRVFPFFMLGFAWCIWLLLKVCQWPRPKISTMLIYSVVVGVALDLQPPISFLWYRFLFDVVFWFLIIYMVMKFTVRINRNQRGNSEA